ncbi:unnamed protein product [Meloidogyne enterolobii]|uniref:Uncharacterized protein n=1 Tax=Meloidogyne enterolobii TaxID=390850 RepID=A0ACB0YW18_MELEN
MAVLYPNFKGIKFLDFETIKVDFNKFSKNQKKFDAEKLKQFLNWRLDMNCVEKPLFEKVQNKYVVPQAFQELLTFRSFLSTHYLPTLTPNTRSLSQSPNNFQTRLIQKNPVRN